MGHLIRSYTIYSYFKNKNYKVEFYLDSDINYDYKFDDIGYFSWEEIKLKNQYDIVVIDSYLADITIYEKLDKLSKLLVCFDDYSRLNYPINSLILNIAPDTKKVIQDNKHKYLLGLEYLPIRDLFTKYKTTKRDNYIFIMLGGNDTLNLNQKVLDSLDTNQKVVIVDNQKSLKIKNKNIVILRDPTDDILVSYMAKAKVAITTASMSLYELSYLEIPTIAIAVSHDQIQGISQLKQFDILTDYMNIEDINGKNLIAKFKKLPNNINSIISNNGLKNIENKFIMNR
jgi:spore coat polysaccharide biosynthesis predicted glycosyltransferase SpsG